MGQHDRDIASALSALGAGPGATPESLQVAQSLIEVLPIPVFFKARDGRYLGVNRAWEDYFGVARSSIVGGQVKDLYPHAPWIAERHRAMDEALWAAPGSQFYELALVTPQGDQRHAMYYKATYTDREGEVAGLIGTVVDVTARKRAEQREAVENVVARYLGGSDSLNDAIRGIIQALCERLDWACGARWSLDEAENRLHCIEDWSIADPKIRHFLDVSRNATFVPGKAGLIRKVLATGSSVWIEDVTRHENFQRAPLAREAGLRGAFALPVVMGERVLGAIEFYSHDARNPDPWLLQIAQSVGRQIGQLMVRRQAEAELRAAHDELAVQARELTRSNEELQQFAYVASHDLQEPLRMVSSYTQLLERRYGTKLDGDAKEFMAYIVDGAARMKQLIEDLLAYSRVGTRGREFETVDAAQALDKARSNLRSAEEASGAVVTHDALPTVVADPPQLTQLFQNLIGNALKFHGAQPPRIHVASEIRPDAWVFSVRDNGIGLDPQYAERIFMMFQRLHTLAEYPGTGIGLAICKKIAERHGGRIWVESRPGEGSTFSFTLSRHAGGANHDNE